MYTFTILPYKAMCGVFISEALLHLVLLLSSLWSCDVVLKPWPNSIKNLHHSGWTVLDQPSSWSWTNESSNHHFSICLLCLPCPELLTGSIYTFFSPYSPHHHHPIFLSLQHNIHCMCRWDQCCGTECDEGNNRAPWSSLYSTRVNYVQLVSCWAQSQCFPLWTCKLVFSKVSKGSGLSLYSFSKCLRQCLLTFCALPPLPLFGLHTALCLNYVQLLIL